MRHIYTVEYYSAIKKNKMSSAAKMNGPGDYHTKGSKSDRERQTSNDIAYM